MRLDRKDYILVGLQIILFILFFLEIEFLSFDLPDSYKIITLIFCGIGAIIIILAMLQLNKSLSPFPTPKSGSQLIQTGLYKYVRHPIYTGIILIFISYSLYSGSVFRLIITLALVGLFVVKSSYEEDKLVDRYNTYSEYRKKTGKFLPKF